MTSSAASRLRFASERQPKVRHQSKGLPSSTLLRLHGAHEALCRPSYLHQKIKSRLMIDSLATQHEMQRP